MYLVRIKRYVDFPVWTELQELTLICGISNVYHMSYSRYRKYFVREICISGIAKIDFLLRWLELIGMVVVLLVWIFFV